ncbi:hypothetical protein Lal_00031959 [Lupinus albus]|nr:hypothetical protein Lal_00031959 [Lupinus albus]
MDWEDLCLQLLGVAQTNRKIMGKMELLEDANKEVVEQQARAFTLRMIEGFLMPDTSGSRVHMMYLPLLYDL